MTSLRLTAVPRSAVRVMLMLLTVVLLVVAGTIALQPGAEAKKPAVPTDSKFENRTGVRVERVTLVGDGGLVDVRYTVLNEQKATKYFADTSRPPHVKKAKKAGARGKATDLFRVAAMRAGHELRKGQTYYVVYLNTDGALKVGDKVELTVNGGALAAVPVW